VYAANDFYGSERILRRAASWERPIKAIVPHGVPLNPFHVPTEIVEFPVPHLLAYSWLSHPWGEAAGKHVELSAAPFVYSVDRVDPVPEPARRPGGPPRLLYFPAHSTVAVLSAPTPSDALSRLERHRADGWDTTVCVYWRDLEIGRADPFERLGFRVATCGHRTDPLFTSRLVSLLSESTLVAGDHFGSHMLYAAYLGRPYISLGEPLHAREGQTFLEHMDRFAEPGEVRFRTDLPGAVRDAYTDLDVAYSVTEPADARAPEQHELARQFLGADNLRSRESLRSILRDAERADRFDTAPRPGGSRIPAVRRQGVRSAWALSRLHRRLRRRLQRRS
jgi:hypothetical protein